MSGGKGGRGDNEGKEANATAPRPGARKTEL